jgi:response regulator NasT
MALRTLIAEDERLIALALRSRLESQGYEVVGIAGSGTAVLDLFALCSPNIVLMDVRMPGMDGIEATGALMLENPACVVIVSGNREPAQIERAERAGAMEYVVKPFEACQMRPVLERAQRRFERFMAMRAQLRDSDQALETWLAVRQAVKLLMESESISEDDAHDQLERRAAKQGVSLQAAAEDIARPGGPA